MSKNIQIIKLTTGEDLIGEVGDTEVDGKAFLTIDKPALIMMMPKPGSDTEFGVGLAPYAPFAKGHVVPIFPAHIVSVYDPAEEILSAYNQKFGAGLVMPTQKEKSIINKQVLNEQKK